MPYPHAINGRFNSENMLCLNVPGDAPYHPCARLFRRWLNRESGIGRTAEDDEEMQDEILGRLRSLDKS